MVFQPIYKDFINGWTADRTWDSIRDEYVRPHASLLGVFYRNFVSADGAADGNGLEAEYKTYWADRSVCCDDLVTRLEGADIAHMVQRTTEQIGDVLRPRTDVHVVALVGLGTTNACQLVYDGVPTVVLAVDAWGRTFFNVELPWADIPLWLSHEYAHVIRYAEGESGFARFVYGGSLDYAAAIEQLSFIEFLVDEGLATAVAHMWGGAAHAAHALGFTDEQFEWCCAHEEDLWREVRPKLHRPLGMDGYSRYFAFGADDIPPRTGYYLGWRIVQRFLDDERTVDVADALRMSASRLFAP